MIALTVSEQNIHLYWIKGLNKETAGLFPFAGADLLF